MMADLYSDLDGDVQPLAADSLLQQQLTAEKKRTAELNAQLQALQAEVSRVFASHNFCLHVRLRHLSFFFFMCCVLLCCAVLCSIVLRGCLCPCTCVRMCVSVCFGACSWRELRCAQNC